MNERLRKFLADAQSFSLTEEERSAIRTRLSDECRMVKVTQHLEHAAAGVKLTEVEKAETLGKILKGMRKIIPREKGIGNRQKGWISWLLHERTFATAIASVFLLFAGGGSVAVAAEASIPGDFLYPIKVQVIERVRGRFYRNPEAQDEWRLTRLRRRIHEAETMAKRQNVPPKQWEVMSVSIEQELGEVGKRNAILRARVEHVLKEDGRELLKLQRVPEKRRHVRPIVETIRKHTEILEGIEREDVPEKAKEVMEEQQPHPSVGAD